LSTNKYIETISPLLNEKQNRLYLAAEARSYGWGGQTKISELSGKSRMLIGRGLKKHSKGEKMISEKEIEQVEHIQPFRARKDAVRHTQS
jgi:hypothetical protein